MLSLQVAQHAVKETLPVLKDVPNLALNLAGLSDKSNEALVPQTLI